jgi:hypothetical protein
VFCTRVTSTSLCFSWTCLLHPGILPGTTRPSAVLAHLPLDNPFVGMSHSGELVLRAEEFSGKLTVWKVQQFDGRLPGAGSWYQG